MHAWSVLGMFTLVSLFVFNCSLLQNCWVGIGEFVLRTLHRQCQPVRPFRGSLNQAISIILPRVSQRLTKFGVKIQADPEAHFAPSAQPNEIRGILSKLGITNSDAVLFFQSSSLSNSPENTCDAYVSELCQSQSSVKRRHTLRC